MNDLAVTSSPVALPAPRRPITVRAATIGDLPFMDGLQKQHSKALGYFPTQQFEGYIEMGGVLLAESEGAPVGYCISRDRYLKRDELGVVYQLCVVPGDQRKLVGASLIKEVFERSAYGCRLYCCWCAQDLDANYFWESLGFVPIAFRGGSGKKKRVHIFWQRRIREADTQTPWWFPSKTDQGAMREDRIVLPIPPGLHWRDPMPVLQTEREESSAGGTSPKGLRPRVREPAIGSKGGPLTPTPPARARVQFGAPGAKAVVTEQAKPDAKLAPAKPPRTKEKIDPQLVARARELRDRYLERVNDQSLLPVARGKYDVSRALEADHPVLHRLAG